MKEMARIFAARNARTHASTTDPESRLYRKAAGREARLCYMGHVTMENRHGLAVAGVVTKADGTAERRASQAMLKAKRKAVGHRITAGADKAYDTKGHIEDLRAINVTPHVAQNNGSGQNRQAAEKLDRCPHDKARELWHVAEAPQNDRMHLWLGQAAWHDAQG